MEPTRNFNQRIILCVSHVYIIWPTLILYACHKIIMIIGSFLFLPKGDAN